MLKASEGIICVSRYLVIHNARTHTHSLTHTHAVDTHTHTTHTHKHTQTMSGRHSQTHNAAALQRLSLCGGVACSHNPAAVLHVHTTAAMQLHVHTMQHKETVNRWKPNDDVSVCVLASEEKYFAPGEYFAPGSAVAHP